MCEVKVKVKSIRCFHDHVKSRTLLEHVCPRPAGHGSRPARTLASSKDGVLQFSVFDDDAFLRCDFAKFERPGTLHNAFTALRKWRSSHGGAFPSEKDVDAVVALFDKTSEDKCEEICRDLARTSAGDLSPMAAFLGGVAGQEVLKACTGKFAPVRIQCLIASTA